MNMKQEKSLNEIFALLRQNDKTGLELLYNLYYNKMYGIAFSVVKNESMAEDAVHNVMYKFMTMNSELFPTANEDTWLFSVVKNEALMVLRKGTKTIPIETIGEIGLEDKSIKDFVDMDEFKSMIKSLSAERREVVTLKVLGDYTHKEIAKMLNKPIGTIQWLYNTSIMSLKAILASLISSIILAIIATFVESINYYQNLSTISNSSDSVATFYIDYLLIAIACILCMLIGLFIIFYKKSENLPTKASKKNI